MRETPFFYTDNRPQHPNIVAVDETRTVIEVNFNNRTAERKFCEKYQVKRVREAVVNNEDAAIEFIENIKEFQSMNHKILEAAIISAINNSYEAAKYFFSHIDEFGWAIRQETLEQIVVIATVDHTEAAEYLVTHLNQFQKVMCDSALERALIQAMYIDTAKSYFLNNFHLFRGLSYFPTVFLAARGEYKKRLHSKLRLVHGKNG